MSVSIYVKNEDGNMLAISTAGKWLYSGFVNRPEWWYKEEATIEEFEDFFEFFNDKTGWVVVPGKLPSQMVWYQDVDEDGNLQEYSRINILSSTELIALMKEHGIHTVFVTND